jgi:PII-like signaling protein
VAVDILKLTCYFGERHRVAGRLVADELLDLYGRHQLAVYIMMRGVEGFGAKHQLRSDVSLTLSEDLPAIAVALDTRDKIAAVADRVSALPGTGLVTLERARLASSGGTPGLSEDPDVATRLSIFVGRGRRVAGAPAFVAVCALLHRRGIAGATVLLGVDGTAAGVRQRATFFAGNRDVPAMVLAVGGEPQVSAALPELSALLPEAMVALERVTICKRDGLLLQPPPRLPDADVHGRPVWQKISVLSSEAAQSDGRPLHRTLTRALQRAGASGVTSLRGVWGFLGDHRPHGDRLWQMGRRVPTVTVAIDRPATVARLFPIIDELTTQGGLVISELVPTVLARGGPGR